MHPISYAIWYEYVAGTNQALRGQIDLLCKDGGKLDEMTTQQLYRKYVAELSLESAQQISADIRHVLDAVNQSTEHAQNETRRYGERISDWSEAVGSPSTALIEDMQQETASIQSAMEALQSQLKNSQAEIARLEQEVTAARTEALLDGLTQLNNRRSFDAAIEKLLAENSREQHSLMMIDIDHFKNINDNFGHTFGDRVIKSVAEILKANIKGSDMAARYGGEEFAVLLPCTHAQGAHVLAEKIRTRVAASRIRRNGEVDALATVTVSVGVGTQLPGETAEAFVARVDAALYASKRSGRNRVTLCESVASKIITMEQRCA